MAFFNEPSSKKQKLDLEQNVTLVEQNINFIEILPPNVRILLNKFLIESESEKGKIAKNGKKNIAKWACVSKTTYNDVKDLKIGDIMMKKYNDNSKNVAFTFLNKERKYEKLDKHNYIQETCIPIFVQKVNFLIDFSTPPQDTVLQKFQKKGEELMNFISVATKTFKNVLYEGHLRICFRNCEEQPLNVMTWLSMFPALQKIGFESLEIIGPQPPLALGLNLQFKKKNDTQIDTQDVNMFCPLKIIIHIPSNCKLDAALFQKDQLKKIQNIEIINHQNSHISFDYALVGQLFYKMNDLKSLTFKGDINAQTLSKFVPKTSVQHTLQFFVENLHLSDVSLQNLFQSIILSPTNIEFHITNTLYLEIYATPIHFKLLSAFFHISSLKFHKNTTLEINFIVEDIRRNTHDKLLDYIDLFVKTNEEKIKNISSLRIILYFREILIIPYIYDEFAKEFILKFPQIQNFHLQENYILLQRPPAFDLINNTKEEYFYNEHFLHSLQNTKSKLENMHFEISDVNAGYKKTIKKPHLPILAF